MPFSLEGAVGYNPNEYPERNYPPGHVFAPVQIITIFNGTLWRTNYSLLAAASHGHSSMSVSGQGTVAIYSNATQIISLAGRIDLIAEVGPIFLRAPTTATYPAGTNMKIYADEFVEHSLARLKDNIQPLKDGLKTIKKLLPRSYTMQGSPSVGFVTEENPDITTLAEGNEGEVLEGISIMKVLAPLVDAVQTLEKRLTALEGTIK